MIDQKDEETLKLMHSSAHELVTHILETQGELPPVAMIWTNAMDVPKEFHRLLHKPKENGGGLEAISEDEIGKSFRETISLTLFNVYNDSQQLLYFMSHILKPKPGVPQSTPEEHRQILQFAFKNAPFPPEMPEHERFNLFASTMAKMVTGLKNEEPARKEIAAAFIKELCKQTNAVSYAFFSEAWLLRPGKDAKTAEEREAAEKEMAKRGDMRWPSEHPDKEQGLLSYFETRSGIRSQSLRVFTNENGKVKLEETPYMEHTQNVFDKDDRHVISGRFCNLLQNIEEKQDLRDILNKFDKQTSSTSNEV